MPPRFPSPTRLFRFLTAWLLLAALAATPAAAQDLVIRFFDVGQGDAALITSPEGKSALIDGGPSTWAVAGMLDQLHIDTLDLVVASHNHADHIRGLQGVLWTTLVRYYMDNGVPATTQVYRGVLEALSAANVTVLEATPRTITLGSATLRVLERQPGPTDHNNGSVGLLLTYGSFTALFTGDAEGIERAYWREHAGLPDITFLKVSHHGSINGTDDPWLDAIRPRVAVISVGATNSYGHPAPETLIALARGGVQVYRTDQAGTIEVTAKLDGSYTVHTEESTFGPLVGAPRTRPERSDSAAGPNADSSVAVQPEPIPEGATAKCRDGTFSYSRSRSGTCSWHRGVYLWLNYPSK